MGRSAVRRQLVLADLVHLMRRFLTSKRTSWRFWLVDGFSESAQLVQLGSSTDVLRNVRDVRLSPPLNLGFSFPC